MKRKMVDGKTLYTDSTQAGYMFRDGKPKGFHLLDHRTVDGKFNIITNSYVTSGAINDSVPYLKRLDRQIERFEFDVKAVGLDAGYFTSHICKGLEDRDIFGAISYRRPNKRKGFLAKRLYKYDHEKDCYVCPAGHELQYKTTNREGFRQYSSCQDICEKWELLSKCTSNQKHVKVITRHVWEDSKERMRENRLSPRGKRLYKRRKETVERSFADAKELHGHRYARMRGISKVQEQSLLCAACQNMKKIALILSATPLLSGVFQIFVFSKGIQRLFECDFTFKRLNLNFSN